MALCNPNQVVKCEDRGAGLLGYELDFSGSPLLGVDACQAKSKETCWAGFPFIWSSWIPKEMKLQPGRSHISRLGYLIQECAVDLLE